MMNPLLLSVIGLRSAALALALAGQTKGADLLYTLADAVEAGQATDAHMATVAELLSTRDLTDADWDAAAKRIADDRARLHAAAPPPPP